jgi:hypothetical protein
MLQLNLNSRTLTAGVAALGVLLCVPTLASAQDDAAARHGRKGHRQHARSEGSTGNSCVDAYRGAQAKEQSAHLREARDLLLECAKSTCSKLMREQCRVRYTQLEDDIPSVVPLVTDESGAPSVDVQVKLDGKPFSQRIEGSSLPVDPGVHEFSFEKDGDVFATQKVMIVQGQRNRPISVSLRSTGKPAGRLTLAASNPAARKETVAQAPVVAESESSAGKADKEAEELAAPESQLAPKHHRSWVPYALATVGVVGLAGFGLGTYWGRKDNDALKTCNMICTPAAVDHVHRVYLAANISLGVGIAALGAATVLWIMHPDSTSKEDAASEKSAYRLGVSPTSSGAVAALSGSF